MDAMNITQVRYKNKLFSIFIIEQYILFCFLILDNNVSKVKGIKGLSSGVFYENILPSFLEVSFSKYHICGHRHTNISKTNNLQFTYI